MCWVLNVPELCIFVNFCKYDRVLNMRWDAVIEGFRIFLDSDYVRYLHMQVMHEVLNMPEYG